MKKILTILLFALLSFSRVEAQQHHSLNFLSGCTSIVVSNGLSWTNLNTTAVGANTNINGLIYTNLLGNQIVATNGDTSALVVDIPLWADRNGNVPIMFPSPTNTTYGGFLSAMEVSINLARCGSGVSTTAIQFIFVPLWDGIHESTASGDLWTVGVTPSAGATVNISTNVPIYQWPGAKLLRLRSITTTRGAASADVAIDSVRLCGFVP